MPPLIRSSTEADLPAITALPAELCARCERVGLRKLIAVIGEASNHASIRAHERNGFTHVGIIPGAGWKFDTWREIVLMHKVLGAGTTAPPDGNAFASEK